VVHDFQDSRLDRAVVARWCFDAVGRGAPAAAAGSTQTHCQDVFYDGTPCGGECNPSAFYLRCSRVSDHCGPVRSPPQ
jgi:hypothetical protein